MSSRKDLSHQLFKTCTKIARPSLKRALHSAALRPTMDLYQLESGRFPSEVFLEEFVFRSPVGPLPIIISVAHGGEATSPGIETGCVQ